jgi:toxin ParE1/3/4
VDKYILTKDAKRDLAAIADYTIETFGVEQARHYRDGLFQAFKALTDSPRIGRDYGHVKDETRRYEHKKHSIYYSMTDDGILILRILHERQDPGLNLLKK